MINSLKKQNLLSFRIGMRSVPIERSSPSILSTPYIVSWKPPADSSCLSQETKEELSDTSSSSSRHIQEASLKQLLTMISSMPRQNTEINYLDIDLPKRLSNSPEKEPTL